MKNIFLLLILSLVFSLISSAPFSHAASKYDDVVKNTDRLIKKENPTHKNCSLNPDISTSHLFYLKSAIQNESRPYRKDEYQKQYAVFKSILDNPDSGYWAIIQNSNGGLHYYFTKKEDFNKIHFSTDGLYIISKPDTKLYTFFLPSYNCSYGTLIWTSVWNNDNQYSYTTSHFVPKSSSWFVNTFPVDYPEGYQGQQLGGYTFKEDITPSVAYSVNGSDFDVYLCSSVFKKNCKPSVLPWNQNTKFRYQIKTNPQDTTSLYDSGVIGIDKALHQSYKLKKGKYYLIVSYEFPGIPYPSHDDKYNFHVLNLPFQIDGSSYISGTADQDCVNGACVEYSPYEDCSAFASHEVHKIIPCHVSNFLISLKSFFVFLFVPDGFELNKSFSDFIAQLKSSLGFLWTPIDFIIKTVQLLIGSLPNPTGDNCSIGNIGFFGSQARPLEFCAWRHKLPDLWAILRLFAQGAIAWLVISMFWRKFAHLFGIDTSGSGGDSDDSSDYRMSDDYVIIDERRGVSQKVGDYRKGGSH